MVLGRQQPGGRMKSFVSLAAVLTVSAFALTACGKEKDKDAEATGRGPLTCSGSAMSGQPELPAGFPNVGGVVYVNAGESGPTKTADGYTSTDLGAMHDGYVAAFKNAGYTVLFEEQEEDDSEVSYKTADGSREGQVALRTCDN